MRHQWALLTDDVNRVQEEALRGGLMSTIRKVLSDEFRPGLRSPIWSVNSWILSPGPLSPALLQLLLSPVGLILLPGVMCGALLLLDSEILSWWWPWQTMITVAQAVLALLSAAFLFALMVPTIRRRFATGTRGWSRAELFFWFAVVVVVVTTGFVGITATLTEYQITSTAGVKPPDARIPFELFNYYCRSLFGMIPLLDIPTTLNWQQGYRADQLGGGGLLLAYKVLLAIPLLHLATLYVGHWFKESPVGADPSVSPIAGELAGLAQLRDSGTLTPEEFEAEKARLLERG